MATQAIANRDETAKSKSTLLVIIAVGSIIAIGGGAAGWFFLHGASAQATAKAATKQTQNPPSSEVKATLHLESFVLNLADRDQSCFLRLGIDLGLGKESGAGKEEDKNSVFVPRVRDVLISVVTTWQADALLGPEGKAKLKQQILEALAQRVPELSVHQVYFTDFLVQR
jgi:flagellar FliL protein